MPVKLNTDKSTLTDGQLELLSSEDGHIPVQGLNGEECLVCIALNDLQKTRAQLALADKVIQAARDADNLLDGMAIENIKEWLKPNEQPLYGTVHTNLRDALAEYDKERAAP